MARGGSVRHRWLEAAQAQRVAQHEHAGQRHRTGSEHRRQQHAPDPVQHAGRDRDQRGVVGEGPEQVLPDVAQRCLRQRDGIRHALQVARHQHHIGRLHRDVGAGTDRQADIGLGQRR
ncbi:hypothetical protein G6F68_016654 [Rhizopus microsporus]|nr:hypothetical protein G6F68_016654 [Rhizopus microsporus]